ncbi:hypothetical protein FSB78_01785 [Sphingomonas ginsenosidivorax]|uniref:DUF2946 domain-containing protein n=1 Tax=Sphingomonas ginsenosidivorax TaxID=862135 RepID=A0A5C6UCZ7_9SPHN|nr:hypothetical protein [Sphingomonas ginsenosidivorax]TXC69828.1 hypothetical protein FSB78_01785 [Sphingomonas ginsenosidivorax]
MLARLILALLLAAFALPASAPAACHDAQVMHAMPMAMPGAMPAAMDHAPEQKATPPHGCIGCVPPSNWSAARLVGPAPRTLAAMIERAAVLDLRDGLAPALRPPRLA